MNLPKIQNTENKLIDSISSLRWLAIVIPLHESPDDDRVVIASNRYDARSISGEFDVHDMRGVSGADSLGSIFDDTRVGEERHVAPIIS